MEKVCVQGLGFVGLAMCIALAQAKDKEKNILFDVVGIDLPNSEGNKKVDKINNGKLPVESTDGDMISGFHKSVKEKNLRASTDCKEFADARIIVIDINLDVEKDAYNSSVDFTGLRKAVESIGDHMGPETLVIVETTVPPGTTENLVYPILKKKLSERFNGDAEPLLAHSYERVMPGPNYMSSITNFWRVYSGTNERAMEETKRFYEKFVNTEEYPLLKLETPRASELAKVLENSYRAANIAFMQEWTQFAHNVGVDLFSIVDAIKIRPTHSNIRRPGLGVGGYCLTKDPLMGIVTAKTFLNEEQEFPISVKCVDINDNMPEFSLKLLKKGIGPNLEGKKVILIGMAYRNDVGDFRSSAAVNLAKMCEENGCSVDCNDPYIKEDIFKGFNVNQDLTDLSRYDAVILCVAHTEYSRWGLERRLLQYEGLILDTNEVLSKEAIKKLVLNGSTIKATGRGDL